MSQSKITEHNLKKVIDILVEVPNYAVAGRAVGISERTLYEYRAQSIKAKNANDTSSPFFLEHRGDFGFWHDHVGRSRAEQLISAEGKIRDQATNGIEEKVYDSQNHPVWKERPEYIGRSDDYVLLSEGCAPDEIEWHRLEHDENGHPVQLTKLVQAPAPIRKAILSASHSDYKDSVDVNVAHSGTVLVSAPLQRLASQPREKMEDLRQLALLSPEARRAKLNGHAAPTINGVVTQVPRGKPDPVVPSLPAPPAYAKPKPPQRSPSTDDHYGPGPDPYKGGGVKVC